MLYGMYSIIMIYREEITMLVERRKISGARLIYPYNRLHRFKGSNGLNRSNSSNRLNRLNGMNGLIGLSPTTRDLGCNKKLPNALIYSLMRCMAAPRLNSRSTSLSYPRSK